MSSMDLADITTAGKPSMTTYRCEYGEIAKLHYGNYTQWSSNIQVFLRAINALDIVLGTEQAPPANQRTSYNEFRLRSGKGFAMIYHSCHPDIREFINDEMEPAEAWTTLKAKLDNTASRAGRTLILRRFNQLRPKSGEQIQTYISQLLAIRRTLAGTDQAISEEAFTSHLISTLPPAFNSFVDIVLHQPGGVTIDSLITMIREAEVTMQNRDSGYSSSNLINTSTSALAVEVGNVRSSRGGHRGRTSRFSRGRPGIHRRGFRPSAPNCPARQLCWYCGLPGHMERQCHVKERAVEARRQDDRNGRGRRRFHSGPELVTNVQASLADVQALVISHSTTALTENSSPWIVDSGATHHLVNHSSVVYDFIPFDQPITIRLADQNSVSGIGKGYICLSLSDSAGCKHDVRLAIILVPQLRFSLLSVPVLSTSFRISFANGSCYLGELGGSRVLMLASLIDGLYRVDPTRITSPSLLPSPPLEALATVSTSLTTWHHRLGHLNYRSVRQLVGSGDIPSSLCEVCIQGKQQQKIIRTPVTSRTTRPLELIHSDLAGPISIPSCSGARYFILYIDDFSRHVWVYYLKTKEAVEVTSRFQEFKLRVEKMFPQFPLCRFRCDNGKGEYDNRFFRGILRASGVSFEPSPPYSQHKNGVSERMIRTIVTKARTMMLDSRLPEEMWAEAIATSVYLHARSPTRTLTGRTPYEVLYERVAPISHLRRFGCRAHKLIPKAQRVSGKFGSRSRECIMLGYVHDSTTIWRLWDPIEKRIIQASNVVFEEDTIASNHLAADVLKAAIPEQGEGMIDATADASDEEFTLPPSRDVERTLNAGPIQESVLDTGSHEVIPRQLPSSGAAESPSEMLVPVLENSSSIEPMASSLAPTSSTRDHARTEGLRRSTRRRFPVVAAADASVQDIPLEPEHYEDAAREECWRKAMRDEYASLLENETFDFVDTVPSDRKVISCRWVFRRKINSDNSTRFKARLVIRGFEQVGGTDYQETFAPVARLTTLRMVLALTTLLGWTIEQMDVVTAFLHPAIDTEVYMSLPQGLEWLDSRGPGAQESKVIACRLNKALYGLKQAPRLWFQDIDTYLKSASMGFIQSTADPNLYLSPSRSAILLLYVDDILIAGPITKIKEEIKLLLKMRYRMSDLGPAKQFLGLRIVQTPELGTTTLSQEHAIDELLFRYGMSEANGVHTPLESTKSIHPEQQCSATATTMVAIDSELSSEEQYQYQSIVGSVMYIMLGSRPDICFAISYLSQYNARATQKQLLALKRLLRYLKQTSGYVLEYQSIASMDKLPLSSLMLHGYSDSDWAGDKEQRRSTGGYLFLFAHAAISWKSQKQRLVTLSSTEAEYVAASEAAKEAKWLRHMFSEFTLKLNLQCPTLNNYSLPLSSLLGSLDQITSWTGLRPGGSSAEASLPPIHLFLDNQSAIHLTENPKFHNRTKHIDVKYHFIRDCYGEGIITLSYIPTGEMLADGLTKPLPLATHRKHTPLIGLLVSAQ